MMTRILLLCISVIPFLSGCTAKKEAPPLALPYLLEYQIEYSEEQAGLVTVTATAELANFYSFEFFHPGGSSRLESTEGKASYQYSESGEFALVVRAHATAGHFIEVADTLVVSIVKDSLTGYSTPLSYPGYSLVWQDEFSGNSLSSDWSHETGTGNNGWGNNELQYYRAENTEVREGRLIIEARKESFGGRNYTSSRLLTKGQQSFQYGRIDIRAALPQGQGIWPALWMLGNNFPTTNWPACGEIDIMEMVGGNRSDEGDDFIFGTVHWSHNGQHAEYSGSSQLSNGIYADGFHVFSIIWDSQSISWYRDDIKYHEIDIRPSELSEFHQPFFFIFNIAVGGNWPGSPNASTQFPQQMQVDYVRVFEKL